MNIKCEIDEKRRIGKRAPTVGRYMDRYNHLTKQKMSTKKFLGLTFAPPSIGPEAGPSSSAAAGPSSSWRNDSSDDSE